MATIKIKRNDTYIRPLNIVDCENEPVDASGWTIYFTVRETIPPTSEITDTGAKISKTIVGQASGEHTLTLTKDDTNIDPKTYVFDIQIKNASGELTSSETGQFVIEADITRTP